MRVKALFSTAFFAKCLCVGEDGPGWRHLCHIDTFLVFLRIYDAFFVITQKCTFRVVLRVLQRDTSDEYLQIHVCFHGKNIKVF